MEFEKILGSDNAAKVIEGRMIRLSEEGFQLQLNIEFIKDRLLDKNITEQENAELGAQLMELQERADNLLETVNWHRDRLERLTSN